MRAFSTLSSLFALSTLLVLPGLAQASTCSADSDCVKGWTCQVSGQGTCAAPACAPGEKCEPVDCAPQEYKSCEPAPCHADSDCADGMVCYTHTESDCAPVACAPGQECAQPACETKTESACVPRYLLPCTAASDCGSGFRCEASEQCACSGGAASSGSDSGSGASGSGASAGSASTPPPPDTSCTCEPSNEKHCVADAVNCSADSDCAAGWSCAVVGATADCASTPAPNPAPGDAQGGAAPTPVPDCRPSAEIKQCVPPYYGAIKDSNNVRHDAGVPGSSTTGDSAGPATPPTATSGDDSGSNLGNNPADGGPTSSAGGCSVTPGARTTGSTLVLFGVLGALSALRRRRAR